MNQIREDKCMFDVDSSPIFINHLKSEFEFLENAFIIKDSGSEEAIFSAVEWAVSAGGDPERVYLFTEGCDPDGWRFAAKYADRLSGIIGLRSVADANSVRPLRWVPVLLIQGSECIPSDPIPLGTLDIARLLRSLGNDAVTFLPGPADRINILNWASKQSINMRYRVNWIKPGLWSIESGLIDSLYLVEGNDRAVAIDTGMAAAPLMPVISSLTRLPVDCLATHVHGDHILHADEFGRTYLSPSEAPLIEPFVRLMMPDKAYMEDSFLPVRDGDIFDLGEVTLEAFALPGHTPGSICYVDRVHRCVFCGDAMGSGIGVLMAIPGTLSVMDYKAGLLQFRSRIEPFQDYTFYGGHRIQEYGRVSARRGFNPLCIELLNDMIELCDRILNGEVLDYEVGRNAFSEEPVYYVHNRRADMWISESEFFSYLHKYDHGKKEHLESD